MKIIISPSKNMVKSDFLIYKESEALFQKETEELLNYLKSCNKDELASILNCNEKILNLNYERYKTIDLKSEDKTAAILSYSGLQYKNLSINTFSNAELDYINNNLFIISGFYGLLRPFDKIVLYRLEFASNINYKNFNNLYDFWSSKIANVLEKENDYIINLASKEYSKAVFPYLKNKNKFINIHFVDEIKNNKLIEKGTNSKIARGQFLREMAVNNVQYIKEIKNISILDYEYNKKYSNNQNIYFIKKGE